MRREKRADILSVCGIALVACFVPFSAFAYGLDGLFGGRPNPDGTVTLDVPLQTEVAPDRAQPVLEHPRPDYQKEPIRLGSFLISPEIDAGLAYQSNIYATPRATGDGLATLQPAVTATSDWNRHFLSLTADSDLDFFADHSSQNTNTALVQADGRYDITYQTWLAARGGYQLQYVPRADLNNNAANVPTVFNLYTAGVTAYRGAGMFHAELSDDYSHFDYDNTPDGGANLSEFNRDENVTGGKITYAANEDFKPYIKGQFNTRDYSTTTARNSQGYRADVGVQWDAGGVTSLDIYTGWLSQDYASFGASPVNSGVDYGGKLTWNVTGLTSVIFDANRSVEEANIDGFSSFMASGGSATVTHELRRNILLEGDLSYTNDKYQGFTARQDDLTVAGAGVRWLINRSLYSDFNYSWNHRASDAEAQGYVDHLILAKLGVRL